jgi:hypothetical protein
MTSVFGLKGFDQQTVLTAAGADDIGGTFDLSIDGRSTGPLERDVTSEKLKDVIDKLGHVGNVNVFRENVGNGFRWTIIFLSKLGMVAPIACSNALLTGTGTPTCTTQQSVPGALPLFDSNLASYAEINVTSGQTEMSFVITALSSVASYHVRVSAWNGVGASYGLTQYSTPATLSPAMLPGKPQGVTWEVVSDTELNLKWVKPLRDGSTPITKYEVEWDSTHGVQEQQIIELSSKTGALNG